MNESNNKSTTTNTNNLEGKAQIIELKQNINEEQLLIEQIELLVNALISTETQITNRFSFYSNIGSGVKIEADWIQHLSKHPKLRQTTLFNKTTVIQRLFGELGIIEFLFIQHKFEYCNEIQPLWINYHKIQRIYHPIFLNAKFRIIQTKHNSEQIIKDISFQYISTMILYLNSEIDTNDEYSIFVDSPLFIQPNNITHTGNNNFLFLQKYRQDFVSKNIEINGKAEIHHTFHHETFEFDSLKICSGGILTVYKWLIHTCLGGSLQIYSEHDIVIEKNGRISVTGKGYYWPYGFGRGKPNSHASSDVYFGGGGYGTKGQRKYSSGPGGKVYGEPELNQLWFGSPGDKEGGGIIELSSKGNIINYGKIDALGFPFGGGSGGSLKLVCKTLKNEGEILAQGCISSDHGNGGDGRIAIVCENMENNGVIKPTPNLRIIDDINDVLSENTFTVIVDEYYEKKKEEMKQRQVILKEKFEKMLVERKVREDEEKRGHFLQLKEAEHEEMKQDKTEILTEPKKCCVIL